MLMIVQFLASQIILNRSKMKSRKILQSRSWAFEETFANDRPLLDSLNVGNGPDIHFRILVQLFSQNTTIYRP
jgi:hypothetical protein